MPRVLAAVSPRAWPRLAAILRDWPTVVVSTREELERALNRQRFDMIIVGMHFDQSAACEVLRFIVKRGVRVPLVCIRALPFERGLGAASIDAFRLASHELGAHNFLDLLEYPASEAGNRRLRWLLQELLPEASVPN
jgi:hypothetical protein